MTPWKGVQPVARPPRTRRTTQTQNKRTQTSMPQVGFEPTIPVFKRAKTVHALDREVSMKGEVCNYSIRVQNKHRILTFLKSNHYIQWFLSLREEHRLKVTENTILRVSSGPVREDVTGG
jgi:hypothetical protein